jgi:hypothetical protein
MKEFTSFGGFALHLLLIEAAQIELERHALETAAEQIEAAAKAKIGDYQGQAGPFSAWQSLADSTKDQRVDAGYPEDEPLLRSGEMRDSIEHKIGVHEAYIGSNSDIALYQELGTEKIPARSFLGGAAFEQAPKIVEELGIEICAVLSGTSKKIPIR